MSVLPQSSRHCVRLSSIPLMLAFRLALTLLLLLPIITVHAQAASDADLIVVLRDGAGTALPGLVVVVRDAGGQQELARATTDASGRAGFTHLIVSDVRVAVSGMLPGGLPLTQRGNDVRGIPLLIGAPPTTITLRVGQDGLVAPDPTLFSSERGALPIQGTPITQVDLMTAAPPPTPRVGVGNAPSRSQTAPAAAAGASSAGIPAAGAPAPGMIAPLPTATTSGWPWGLLVMGGLGALGALGVVVYLRDQGGR